MTDAPTQMTPAAKRALKDTIRSLRGVLLADLRDALDGAYRLSLRARDAGLGEAARRRRERLEAWIAEQLRAQNDGPRRSREDFLREVEKQAAYTLLNRLVILRLVEERRPPTSAVVRGGWNSAGYADFRALARALATVDASGGGDETEGYGFVLELIFEELSLDLPGLFGPAGVAELVPTPARALRAVVEALDDPDLHSCWSDDMTLGWVYQYWNDPEREDLDAKLNQKGKLERHEIASKTQMFTERYMVDWLLQNSLGPMWLAMCRRHGWTPAVEADGTLDRLEARRVEWRQKRDAGEVSLTALMPLHSDAERRWAYYVPQPIPEDAVTHAPETVRELKILDPAVGSGHFLVVAFDLLRALYHEEARHRGLASDPEWSDRAIAERILEHNLHGIDLDPRAIQIAAAALWLKATAACFDAHPAKLNLVASNLRLASLPKDDPALVELREGIERETGLPAALTNTLVEALHGADHLGSLLRIDAAVEDALEQHETAQAARSRPEQGNLFSGYQMRQEPLRLDRAEARASVLERLEAFLARHTGGDDVGLRLRGEQLAAGVRFVRMVREGTYDLVVANPPYQGTSKMKDAAYVKKHYPRGKADLYAAFLERGLELVREGGTSAMLTMRNWMFIQQYADLRAFLLGTYRLSLLGDLSSGAFEEISAAQVVVSVAMSIFAKKATASEVTPAIRMFEPATVLNIGETLRKRAASLCHVGRYAFATDALRAVPAWPLIYWWSPTFLDSCQRARKVGDESPVHQGMATSNNARFLRSLWEISFARIGLRPLGFTREPQPDLPAAWVPYVKGAAGQVWIEAVDSIVDWRWRGLGAKLFNEWLCGSYSKNIKNEDWFFRQSISFNTIGNNFSARAIRYASAFDVRGSCVFPVNVPGMLACLNSKQSKLILEAFNPGINFQVGDVNRLPIFPVTASEDIWATINNAFTSHESHREPSVEFRQPGPSPWRHAQEWAQAAVDRPEGAPLPPYEPVYDPEPPVDHLSFALGVALGRFGANGEGILDPSRDDLTHALPAGILFLDGTLAATDHRDSLGSPAAQILHTAWAAHGPAIDAKASLRDYLRTKFFAVHKSERMYDNRPIHWPLSSKDKTFVAWVNIHRLGPQTLRVLLADHLHPTLTRLDGELTDLRGAKEAADKKAAHAADKRYSQLKPLRDELDAFIRAVAACAEQGRPRWPAARRARPTPATPPTSTTA